MVKRTFTVDEAQLDALAARIALHAQSDTCVLLRGTLGAGKTRFATAFIRALCSDAHVTSPTFTLAQPYTCDDGRELWHYDLYRLDHAQAVAEIGLPEVLERAITLIEWPDVAAPWLHEDCIDITFAFLEKEGYRNVAIEGESAWIQQL